MFDYPEERDRYYRVVDSLFGVKPSERGRRVIGSYLLNMLI